MLRQGIALQLGLSLALLLGIAHAADTIKPLTAMAYQNQVARTDYAAHSVTIDRFLDLMRDRKAVILDLRDEAAFTQSHIKNAKHLGMDIDADKLAKLIPDKSAPILLYCTNSLQQTRMISQTNVALPQFLALGYRQVYLLKDAASDSGSFIEPNARLVRLQMVTEPPPKPATGSDKK